MFVKLVKNIIAGWYHALFPYEEPEFLTQDERKKIFKDCLTLNKNPSLKEMGKIWAAKSEFRQLYEPLNTPIQTTLAELERQKREGVADFLNLIKFYADKTLEENKPREKQAKYDAL